MREGTTSRVMAADRPYGELYDFYSVSPEYFGYRHVYMRQLIRIVRLSRLSAALVGKEQF
jgi:hypothetical protein